MTNNNTAVKFGVLTATGCHRTAWGGSLSAQPIRPPVNLQKKNQFFVENLDMKN
jgi:hypothetical protein